MQQNLFALIPQCCRRLQENIDFATLKRKIFAYAARKFIKRINVYIYVSPNIYRESNVVELDLPVDFPRTNIACLSLIPWSVKCILAAAPFVSGKTMKNSCKWKINAHKPNRIMQHWEPQRSGKIEAHFMQFRTTMLGSWFFYCLASFVCGTKFQ